MGAVTELGSEDDSEEPPPAFNSFYPKLRLLGIIGLFFILNLLPPFQIFPDAAVRCNNAKQDDLKRCIMHKV